MSALLIDEVKVAQVMWALPDKRGKEVQSPLSGGARGSLASQLVNMAYWYMWSI